MVLLWARGAKPTLYGKQLKYISLFDEIFSTKKTAYI